VDVRLADCVEACRCVEPAKRPSFKQISLLLVQIQDELAQKGNSSGFE